MANSFKIMKDSLLTMKPASIVPETPHERMIRRRAEGAKILQPFIDAREAREAAAREAASEAERHHQEYEKARRAIEAAIEKGKNAKAPSTSVDGIALSSGTSPVAAKSTSETGTVSIVQDAQDDDVKKKIIQSSVGPQPVILSSVKMPSVKRSDIDDAMEVNQFERQIMKESLIRGLKSVLEKDPKGTGTSAKEISKQEIDELKKRVSAIAYMQESADIAATGLDVAKLSGQIMQRSSDAMASLVFPTEAPNKPLPKNIDEYISLTFPTENLRFGIDGYLTNTSRLVVIAQDMMMAALSTHPTVLQHFSRNPVGGSLEATSLFTPPGAYGYDPDGPGGSDSVNIPIVSQLFAQNSRTIVNQFLSSKSGNGPREMHGVLNKGNIDTVDEAWDTVLHMITCISNEMIMSAGIGRLVGSQLGGRFLKMSLQSPGQYTPLDRVLGFPPASTSTELGRFFESGPDNPGSFLDYLALGEESDKEDFVVMPFEVNTVIQNGKPYVSGKKYFIDLAIQSEGSAASVRRDALRRFSSNINKFTTDMSSYFTELMALDVDTPLAPQSLMARILQDFSSVLESLNQPTSQVVAKSATTAALFAYAGNSPDVSSTFGNQKRETTVTISDILKMSVVKALRDFDRNTKDPSFILSNKNTNYQLVTESMGENPEKNLGKLAGKLLAEESSGENPEGNLSKAIEQLPRRALKKQTKFSSENFSRAKYTYETTDVLYDIEFSSSDNLINLIAGTIREIQKETMNLAQRNGAKVDYRNNAGGTFMSDCDDDRFIDVMCELYFRIAYLLIPIGVSTRQKETKGFGKNSSATYEFIVDINTQCARSCAATVGSIARALINGSEINSDAIFYESSVAPETLLSVSPRGDNSIITKAGDITLAASRVVRHRYYIKSSLKILESISAGVSASSAKISTIFDILGGAVKREKLKDLDLVLYDMFVTNSVQNSSFLRNISEPQANLCAAASYNYISDEDVFMRKDIDTSRSERLAARDFIKSIYDLGELDDLHVVSVGLPSGMLESLYRPAIDVETSDTLQAAQRGSEGQSRGRIIRLEIDRYDGAHFNAEGSVESDIFGKSPSPTEFDPEIFILPGSIAYVPENKSPDALSIMDAIFQSTTFYRIRNGTIIERTLGSLVEPGQERSYVNALRSYLLDIFLYESVRIRYHDGLSPYGPPRMTREGYNLLKTVSSDFQLSRVVMNTVGFDKLFDDKKYQLKDSASLKTLLTPRSVDNDAEFSETDVHFAAALSSLSPLMSKSSVIVDRPFERIYHFLYDESIVRNNITGDDIKRKAKRKQFDMFTLALRVSYGGGA